MTRPEADQQDKRVLVLAPTGRDASLTARFLAEAGVSAEPSDSIEQLCADMEAGAGAALISEEALTPLALKCLVDALAKQPAWSDFPLVILTSGGGASPANLATLKSLGEVGNMTLIERPTRVFTLVSAVQAALRARLRQYQVRDHLEREQRAQAEAERARLEAEAANRAKDIFLATLSHELRTPLTAVLGWARILRTMTPTDEMAQHGLHVIERNAESQNQLIQDLLDVSRIVTGKLRLEVVPVRLIPVIEAAVDSVQQAIEARGLELAVEFTTETDLVRGDPARLQQVIWNLLTNAIKFTPKGGTIGVSLERRGSDVQIRVRDTGQGINPEFLPHVFERFRQEDGSTTRAHGGLGLGLAVVRHLVEQHGGTVAAESGGEKLGATFIINLPIVAVSTGELQQPAARSAAEEAAAKAEARLYGVRVLVVDDQPDARELLTLVLSFEGAEVVTAESSGEALEMFRESRPDVLVSDIGMPLEDGLTLIRRIREFEAAGGGSVPAIALTAYATDDDRHRSLDAGFNQHLAKPIEPSELVGLVATLAGRATGHPTDGF